MKPSIGIVLIAVVVLLIIMSLSLFIVDQRQNAIVFRFGEIVSVKKEPGLAVKMPLIDNVRFFDIRVLTIDSAEPPRDSIAATVSSASTKSIETMDAPRAASVSAVSRPIARAAPVTTATCPASSCAAAPAGDACAFTTASASRRS